MQKSAPAMTWRKMLLVGSCALTFPLLLNGCGALLVTGAGAGAQVAQEDRSIGTMMYDEKVEQESYKILKSNTLLSQSKDMSVTVTCFNGNVLLTGQTINKDYIKWVVKQIEKLEHVRRVYNYVTLQAPVPASVVTSDTMITSKVKTQLLFGKGIDSNNIKVVTENANVFLMGIVTRDAGTRATNEALGVEGVRRVYQIFDYIQVPTYTTNGPQAEENLQVTPVKGKKSDYYNQSRSGRTNYGDSNHVVYDQYNYSSQGYNHPVQPTSGQAVGGNTQLQDSVYRPPVPVEDSTYVPPVQSEQNGGAYIIDDNSPGALVQ